MLKNYYKKIFSIKLNILDEIVYLLNICGITKKMKRLFKIFRNISILIFLMILAFYIFILNAWKIDFTEEEIKPYIAEIKQAEKLPDLFYELYNVDNRNSLEYGTLEYLTKNFLFIKTIAPPSVWIARLMYISKDEYRNYQKFLKIELSLATKIDKEISSKEQLNFIVQETNFAKDQIGLKSAAKFYFNKEIKELNRLEMAKLVVMTRNPSFFNPKRRLEKLNQEAELLLKRI